MTNSLNRFVTLINGVRTLVTAIASSRGSQDANKIISTGSDGKLDVSLFPSNIGSGNTSAATSTVLGTILVNTNDSNNLPKVYRAPEVDTLLSSKVSIGGILSGTPSAPTLVATSVTPGSYTSANITVSADGRITNASSSPSASPATTTILGTVLVNTNDSNSTPKVYRTSEIDSFLSSKVNLGGVLGGTTTSPTLTSTAVTPGSYTSANITVGADGRITAASSSPSTSPATTTILGTVQVNSNDPGNTPKVYRTSEVDTFLSSKVSVGGVLSGTPSAPTLAATTVTAGSYTNANITVAADGRITNASSSAAIVAATTTTLGIVEVNSNDPGNTPKVYRTSEVDTFLSSKVSLGGVLGGTTSAPTLTATTVTPGIYTYANITVAADGRITAASSAPIVRSPVNLVDGATISLDASLGLRFRVTLAGNRTLATPTNPIDGQSIEIEITQDATGGRTLTLPSNAVFGTDAPSSSYVLSTTPGLTDLLRMTYYSRSSKWAVVAFIRGFNV